MFICQANHVNSNLVTIKKPLGRNHRRCSGKGCGLQVRMTHTCIFSSVHDLHFSTFLIDHFPCLQLLLLHRCSVTCKIPACIEYWSEHLRVRLLTEYMSCILEHAFCPDYSVNAYVDVLVKRPSCGWGDHYSIEMSCYLNSFILDPNMILVLTLPLVAIIFTRGAIVHCSNSK